MPQLGFFFLDDGLHLGLKLVALKLLEEVSLHLDPLGLIIPLHSDELGLSISELEEILGQLHLLPEILSYFLLELLELEHVLLLELLQRQVSSGLVIAHVIIPSLRKLEELSFLGSLNILQLLLLSSSNIIFLPDSLFSEQLIELASRLLGLLIVALDLALLSVLLEKAQKVQHFVICGDIDDSILRALPDEILPVQIVRVILRKVVLDLLHHFQEVVEGDEFWVRDTFGLLRPDLLEELLGLLGIPL